VGWCAFRCAGFLSWDTGFSGGAVYSVPLAHARSGSCGPRGFPAFPVGLSGCRLHRRCLRSQRIPRSAVPPQGGAVSPVSGFIPGPCSGLSVPVPHGSGSVRVRSSWICKTPACLSRCWVYSPAFPVWLRECSARVLIGPWQHGPVRCLLRPRRAVPVRRLWCFPFAVNRSRQPVPARRVRCDAVASWFTANCFPMSSERWMGNSRGFVSIDVSGSGFASSAGFPSRRLARSVFRGEDGILRSLVRVSPFRKVWIDALHAVPSLSPWFLVRCLASRLGFPVRFSSMVIHHLGVLAVFPDVSHAARN
jgi:hypothetical protein